MTLNTDCDTHLAEVLLLLERGLEAGLPLEQCIDLLLRSLPDTSFGRHLRFFFSECPKELSTKEKFFLFFQATGSSQGTLIGQIVKKTLEIGAQPFSVFQNLSLVYEEMTRPTKDGSRSDMRIFFACLFLSLERGLNLSQAFEIVCTVSPSVSGGTLAQIQNAIVSPPSQSLKDIVKAILMVRTKHPAVEQWANGVLFLTEAGGDLSSFCRTQFKKL